MSSKLCRVESSLIPHLVFYMRVAVRSLGIVLLVRAQGSYIGQNTTPKSLVQAYNLEGLEQVWGSATEDSTNSMHLQPSSCECLQRASAHERSVRYNVLS